MKVRSSVQPQEVTVLANSVLVASNITPYEEEVDDKIITGYEYDGTEYSKDEYLVLQTEKVAALEQELQAAKILLGVD
jgi:hypothetical protein